MIIKIMAQYIDIYLRIGVIALVCTRFKHMRYGFDVVLLRYILFGDDKPMMWLRRHPRYIWFVVFIVSQVQACLQLIYEARMGLIGEKSTNWMVSGILSVTCIGFILYDYFITESRYDKVFESLLKGTIKRSKYKKQ